MVKQPQDRKPKRDKAVAAAADEPDNNPPAGRLIAVEFDDETWVIDPQVIQSPEVLYLLAEMQGYAEDADYLTAADIPEALTAAMDVIRLIFGRQQGRRFARSAPDLDQLGTRLREFFESASTQAGSPDPTGGPGSSASTEDEPTQPSGAGTA